MQPLEGLADNVLTQAAQAKSAADLQSTRADLLRTKAELLAALQAQDNRVAELQQDHATSAELQQPRPAFSLAVLRERQVRQQPCQMSVRGHVLKSLLSCRPWLARLWCRWASCLWPA